MKRVRQLALFGTCLTICYGLIYTMSRSNFSEAEPTQKDGVRSNPVSTLTSRETQQIQQAIELEEQSRFKDAIALIDPIQSNNPVEVFKLIQFKQQLAAQIFNRAEDQYRQGNVARAIKIASAIPLDTPAQQHYQKVQADWSHDFTVLELAKRYQAGGSNVLAIDLLRQLNPTVQASQTIQTLRAQSEAKIRAAEAYRAPHSESAIAPESELNHDAIAQQPKIDSTSVESESQPIPSTTSDRYLSSSSSPTQMQPRAKATQQSQVQCKDPTCDFKFQ